MMHCYPYHPSAQRPQGLALLGNENLSAAHTAPLKAGLLLDSTAVHHQAIAVLNDVAFWSASWRFRALNTLGCTHSPPLTPASWTVLRSSTRPMGCLIMLCASSFQLD
jgi:hypothetical protein